MSSVRSRLGSSYINDDGQRISLSSHSYVPVRIRGEETDFTALMIRKPRNCEEHTICEWCAEGWTWDYEIAFDRTKGGRELRDRAVSIGADLDAWQRWGTGTATDADAARMHAWSARCGARSVGGDQANDGTGTVGTDQT